jgi:hypothetical protein
VWATHVHTMWEQDGAVLERILSSDIAILGAGFWHLGSPDKAKPTGPYDGALAQAQELFTKLSVARGDSKRPLIVWRSNCQVEAIAKVDLNQRTSLALDTALLQLAGDAGLLAVPVFDLYSGSLPHSLLQATGNRSINESIARPVFTLDGTHPLPRVLLQV